MNSATQENYSPAAKTWHWLTAALIVLQVIIGWTMPGAHHNKPPVMINDVHMTIGLLLLVITVLRFGRRALFGTPAFVPGMPAWQVFAAHALHLALYALIILFVITGWANATAHGWPVRIFGVIPLPAFPAWSGLRTFGHIHNLLVWVLIGAVALHVLAALWHHFVARDRTLLRMLPAGRTS